MREIKFRGMGLNGEWYYGLLAHTTDKRVTPSGHIGWCISNSVGCAYAYQVRPETIGQFTGIKDKNGKEIYEGDILLDDNGRILQVEWVNLRFRFKALRPTNFFYSNEIMQWFMDGFKWPKVIGNIYENPELLEAA